MKTDNSSRSKKNVNAAFKSAEYVLGINEQLEGAFLNTYFSSLRLSYFAGLSKQQSFVQCSIYPVVSVSFCFLYEKQCFLISCQFKTLFS